MRSAMAQGITVGLMVQQRKIVLETIGVPHLESFLISFGLLTAVDRNAPPHVPTRLRISADRQLRPDAGDLLWSEVIGHGGCSFTDSPDSEGAIVRAHDLRQQHNLSADPYLAATGNQYERVIKEAEILLARHEEPGGLEPHYRIPQRTLAKQGDLLLKSALNRILDSMVTSESAASFKLRARDLRGDHPWLCPVSVLIISVSYGSNI